MSLVLVSFMQFAGFTVMPSLSCQMAAHIIVFWLGFPILCLI